MPEVDEFQPDWASPPGETISALLRQQHLSVDEFASRIGKSSETVASLLEGRRKLTPTTARLLHEAIGGSVDFWLARERQYREDLERLESRYGEWYSQFPLADMAKFGWLDHRPRPHEAASYCLRFFGVRSPMEWARTYEGLETRAAFRTSPSLKSDIAAVVTWLRQGEIEAERLSCAAWDPNRFRRLLPELRRLTLVEKPDKFIPELQRRCADCGVAVTVVRSPRGCRASGAVRFLQPDKAHLQLSFRYLTEDQFWFTFFHEAGHLLLHSHDDLFLEGLSDEGSPGGRESQEREEEASQFAAQTLIPPDARGDLRYLRLTGLSIARFARRIGVSPGIVVGQLQHMKRVPRNHFNGLKRRYEWTE